MTRPFDTLILSATPRSGSTLLCSLLESSGVAGRPESWYRREDRAWYADDWALPRDANGNWSAQDYLQAVKTHARSANGIVALRVMWETLNELLDELGGLFPAPDPMGFNAPP